MAARHSAQKVLDNRVDVLRAKLVMCALGFVDSTLAEADSLAGSTSTSLPVEFVALHETAEDYRKAVFAAEKLRDE